MDTNANQTSENIQELNIIEEIMHHASKNTVAKLNNRWLNYLPLNPKRERRNIVVFEPKIKTSNKIFIGY